MVGCWTRKQLLILFALLEVLAVLFATRLLIRAQPRSGSAFDDGAEALVPSSLVVAFTRNGTVTAAASDLRKRNDASLHENSFSSLLSFDIRRLVELVPPRAFLPWNNGTLPPPCPPAEIDWTTFRAQRSKTRTGFLFVKVPKTGSSTGASVNLRIASRIYQRAFGPANGAALVGIPYDNETLSVATKLLNRRQNARRQWQRQRQQQQRSNNRRRNQLEREPVLPPLCKNRVQHANTHSMGYDQRHKSRSVLWTLVRDPTDRALSEFFHFHVSRRGHSATNGSAFRDYVHARRARFRNFQVQYLSLRKLAPEKGRNDKNNASNDSSSGDGEGPPAHPVSTLPSLQSSSTSSSPHPAVTVDTIRSIFRDYDFVGVSERMEESLVALQLLLGLEASDILHMSSKVSGGYDDGLFQERCVYIQPSIRTPYIQSFFAGRAWRRWTKWDAVLHRAANVSLDLTIERLGVGTFRGHLEAFRELQRRVHAACSGRVRFPCDASRDGRPRRTSNETDCLLGDMGCGFGCIDRHVASMGRL